MAGTEAQPAIRGGSARGRDGRSHVVGVRCRLYLDVADDQDASRIAISLLGQHVLDPGVAIGVAVDDVFEPDPEDLATD